MISPNRLLLLLSVAVALSVIIAIVQAQPKPTGGSHGSTRAAKRLMKELQGFYESESHKNGVFTVELINDNIYEWDVKVLKIDPDSELHEGLQGLKKQGTRDYVLLRLVYDDNYPFSPPFVRVVYPDLASHAGAIMAGGLICTELLTEQGWSSSYTIEPLVLQLIATMSGDAVVSGSFERYTYEQAKKEYDKYLGGDHKWSHTGKDG